MTIKGISDISLEEVLGDLRADGVEVSAGPGGVGVAPPAAQTSRAALSRRLDVLASRMVRILHDRRRPWTVSSIDHLVVCPAGVVVVEVLDTPARPSLQLAGPADGPWVERLLVGDRDGTAWIEALQARVRAVTGVLGRTRPELPGVDVHGVLCCLDDEGPKRNGAFAVGGVHVLSPQRLGARLGAPGPLQPEQIEQVTTALATTFSQAGLAGRSPYAAGVARARSALHRGVVAPQP